MTSSTYKKHLYWPKLSEVLPSDNIQWLIGPNRLTA